MKIGVSLPVFLSRSQSDPADLPVVARHAEDLGLDAVWSGDHLSIGAPLVESTVTLAAAAAATERIELGFGVMLLALRQPAWAAKQIGSLQLVSRNRLVLGVGVGGEWPAEWQAAGIEPAGRGRRTDAILDALPGLLAGEPTKLTTEPGQPEVTLAPAVPMPPLWVGGITEHALRRAVRVGQGWLGSMITPGQAASLAVRLAELAGEAGVAVPSAGTALFIGGEPFVRYLVRVGRPREQAEELVIDATAERIAERIHACAAGGLEHVMIATAGSDVRGEYDQVAEARALLGG